MFEWLLLKHIVKHTIWNTFGSQISLQSVKNIRTNYGLSMVAIKINCTTYVFATFGLQDLSPEPLQNLSKTSLKYGS